MKKSRKFDSDRASDNIEVLIRTMDEISRAESVTRVYSLLEEMVNGIFETDGMELFLYSKEKQELYLPKEIGELKLDMTQPSGLIGRVLISREPVHYNYALSEKEFDRKIDMPSGMKIRSLMFIPIYEDDGYELLAILRLFRGVANDRMFMDEDIRLAKSLIPFLKKVILVIEKGFGEEMDLSEEVREVKKQIDREIEGHHDTDFNNLIMDISSMVHDIRTPANTLGGFLELLEEHIEDGRLLEYIRNAKESAIFINNLTTSILNSVKYGSKANQSEIKTVYTNRFFASIAEGYTASMFNKNIDYYIYIDPSLPKEIRIDELKLKRVLINLIGNAWKFTPKGKSVTLDVRYSNDKKDMVVSVIDTGLGIEAGKQQEIFEAFKQVEGVEGETDGSGLGLAIVHQYVRSMGGELTLKSKLDIGSVFRFNLPLEIVNEERNVPKYEYLEKKISIITKKESDLSVRWLKKYMTEFGLPLSRIETGRDFSEDTTHIICFENSLERELLERARQKGIKVILFEENFLSLDSRGDYKNYPILSKGTYYGQKLFDETYFKPPLEILIMDDNKINIALLEAVLENEHVNIHTVTSIKEAHKLINETKRDGKSYDIVFLDKYLPDGDGDDIAALIKSEWKDTLVISITGDPDSEENLPDIYDMHIPKPFSRKLIQKIVKEFQ